MFVKFRKEWRKNPWDTGGVFLLSLCLEQKVIWMQIIIIIIAKRKKGKRDSLKALSWIFKNSERKYKGTTIKTNIWVFKKREQAWKTFIYI